MGKIDVKHERYDVLVIGSGEAGKYTAWDTAAAGQKTALIERRYIGGSCPNVACLPSKSFIHSANTIHTARHIAEYGMVASGSALDLSVVRARKRSMVDGRIEAHQVRFKASGAELILGDAKFLAPDLVEVQLTQGQTRRLSATRIVISTGTRPTMANIPGLAAAAPLTHIEALELGAVPQHLIILGGGFVGLEFAQAMRRFGSRVTIVDRNDRLLPHEDLDVSEFVAQVFQAEGIETVLGATVQRVTGRSGELITLDLERDGKSLQLEGTHLLVAVGRTPNTDGMGLDDAGVELTPEHFVRVNERLETSVRGIFAVGECAGSPQFTHAAYDDFRVLKDTMNGGTRVTTGRLIPSCLFLDPEVARVGLNEREAAAQGIPYRLLKLPMTAALRACTTGETTGFLKALLSTQDDTILGFTGVATLAGEMMAPVHLAMAQQLPYTVLRDWIVAHPTWSEAIMYLFSGKPSSRLRSAAPVPSNSRTNRSV